MRKLQKKGSRTDEQDATKKASSTTPFDLAFIEDCKVRIKRIEELELDKPDRTFSKSLRQDLAIACLARLAIDALPGGKRVDVLVKAEEICNQFGYTFFPDGITVDKCPTRRHKDCAGAYVNKSVGSRIICKCPCHSRAQ